MRCQRVSGSVRECCLKVSIRVSNPYLADNLGLELTGHSSSLLNTSVHGIALRTAS